ncbi:VOC family protein [Singulisphaera acidiphila]|uniref:Lactoylglutathione lyase family protein n=1 Tax=Singulisphaera acidiphila (strain ATCC BAA-1392 / DSM 18658 / VKM B-2454 / MOB10) TaxID=886293 RepID=L0DK14_SINAD|nr:VOC family protein [Singulisphaera acidiphila]AGA29178.1 lactoylglutathione lyase family protein [Singulisphaera acidiphila DSM 18658]
MDAENSQIELAFPEIRVIDWPRAVRWYVEVMGLRLVLEDVAHQFALLGAGGSRLALKAGERRGGETPTVRLVFRVNDVEAERERLIARGVEVGPAMENRAEAYRSVTLVDSDGTPITLFSWQDSLDPNSPQA